MRVLAALDKFKGTATSVAANDAVVRAARSLGLGARAVPMSDGGDGVLDVFGGATRHSSVTAPDGRAVRATWRYADGEAVIESALASGLVLVGEANDAVRATSRGTGELLDAAVRAGATRIVVGLGGSATTDGGLGALDALSRSTLDALRGHDVRLDVCCDVDTRYVDAARVFGPQKGATPEQIELLTRRLVAAQDALTERFGIDVSELDGGGAAGGLGGALAAVGGHLVRGVDVVAEHVGLDAAIAEADIVLTGEGRVDGSSFAGKVVGGVLARCRSTGTTCMIVAGDIGDGAAFDGAVAAVSLRSRFGVDAAMSDAVTCIERAALELLSSAGPD